MAQRDLTLNIGANTKGLNKALGKMRRDVRSATGNITASMQQAGRNMTMALTAPLGIMAAQSMRAFDEQAKAIAQVEAGLKSTGNAVGFTSKQLQQMASDLQNKTIFGDEEILKGATAQLLTFTNIAGDNFARTQAVALDLATRLDGDLKSASIQLGKALNDPVANLTALSRAGIQFSDDQKEVIKSLAETGQLAEAQTIILDELEKQYGGSAEAAAKAGMGPFKQLQNTIGDISEEFGRLINEFLAPIIPKIQSLAKSFANLNDRQKKVLLTVGAIAAAAGPIVLFASALFKARIAMAALNMVMAANPIGAVVAGTLLLVGALATLKASQKTTREETEKFIIRTQELDKEQQILALNTRRRALETELAQLKTAKAAEEAATQVGALGDRIEKSVARNNVGRFNDQITDVGEAIIELKKATADAMFGGGAATLSEITGSTEEDTQQVQNSTAALDQKTEAIKRMQAAMKAGEKLGLDPDQLNVGGLLGALGEGAGDGTAGVFASQFILSDEQIAAADAGVQTTVDNAKKNLEDFQSSMLAFGQSLAGGIQNVFNQLAQGGQSFGQIMGDILKQLLIKLASMVAAFAVLTVLTGGSVGTLGSFLKGGFGIPGATPMADGGIVSGPSHILAGEYPGAKSNPEVIAPLSKLKGMMGGGNLSARVSGRDLLFTGNRDKNHARRQYTSTLI